MNLANSLSLSVLIPLSIFIQKHKEEKPYYTLPTLTFVILLAGSLALAIFIAFFVIAFQFVRKQQRTISLEEDIKAETQIAKGKESYYGQIAAESENVRELRHDINNHIYTIDILLKDKRYDELGDYIESLNEKASSMRLTVETGNRILNLMLASLSEQYPQVTVKCLKPIMGEIPLPHLTFARYL